MENFSFYSPTYFLFGKKQEHNTGECVKKFGGTKLLIHYGGGSVIKSGVLDRVKKSLDEQGIAYAELGGAQPNPRSGLVYRGIELCRNEKVDFVLAVGGGSVIDSAKAIAAGVPYAGDFWDFFKGKNIEKALPVGTVLTISAAGSEASPNMVITHEDAMLKRGAASDLLRPAFSILNPELTCTLPDYQTACGAVDIMAHVFERYFSNTTGVEITDRFCEAVLLTIINETPRALADKNDYHSRANIMWAGMAAHNNLCGVGREQDWASHALEHEISALYDVAHGAGLAVVFPAWMKYVMKHDVARFAQLAVRVFGCEMDKNNPEKTAKEGIEKFEKFLKLIEMPATFAEIGARKEDIPALVEKIGLGKNGTLGNFVKLTNEDITKIYELAL